MNTVSVTSRTKFLAGLLLCACGLWSVGAYAASDCAIGLKTGTTPTLDGQEGGQWADASVLNSASSCFGSLTDYVLATDMYSPRNVTVKSKRYQRDGTWRLGFLFEVQDSTNTGPCSAGKLCIGEKIIMQFNRVINGDTKLNVGQDKRFSLTHKWAGTGDDITDGVIQVDPPVTDASCTATSGVDVQWGSPAGNGITYAIRKDVVGGGYRAEIEVPVSFVSGAAGDLPDDIGMAFAVVNDFGKNSFGGPPDFNCAAGGTCEGAGVSFPSSLPETNDENPVDAICDKGWVIPKQWGVGYKTNPPGQVTISRLPNYWSSNGIEVFECDNPTPSYTYYPAKPCKAIIRANLRNTGSTTRRKVVYLWAKHGTGDPTEYNFVDIQSAVVSAGTPATPSSTWVPSALWAGMPKNQANHPCLRAYIFPDSLSAADENILRGTTTGGVVSKASLDAVVAANGVEEQHWAQKNISRHSTTTECPDAACRVAGASLIRLELIRSAAADNRLVAAGTRAATTPGILLPGADWERYAKDHVIVRVRTIAYRIPAGGRKPLYNLVEDFGGVVQMFPLEMVKARRELPVELLVSNGSRSTMRIKVLTEMHAPAGVPGVRMSMPRQDLTLQPGSTTNFKATLENPSAPPVCEGPLSFCCEFTKRDGVALGTGVLLVGLAGAGFGFRRRRKG